MGYEGLSETAYILFPDAKGIQLADTDASRLPKSEILLQLLGDPSNNSSNSLAARMRVGAQRPTNTPNISSLPMK